LLDTPALSDLKMKIIFILMLRESVLVPLDTMTSTLGVYPLPSPLSKGPLFPIAGFVDGVRSNAWPLTAGAVGVPAAVLAWNAAYGASPPSGMTAVRPMVNSFPSAFSTFSISPGKDIFSTSFESPAPVRMPSQTPAPASSPSASKGRLSSSKRLEHLGKAALFILAALLLRHLPGSPTRLQGTLLSPDWKEWAKVGLGIAGMKQINDTLGWKPPLWLNAMLNVICVNPLVSGFAWKNIVQGLMLAPVVGVMAQASHYASDKSEKPLEKYLHIPPLVTRALFSIGTMLAGLKVFPRVNDAIPRLGPATAGATVETSVVTSCANGCCASAICANDMGQLGATLLRSLRGKSDQDAKAR
jgi:hypothetical protein